MRNVMTEKLKELRMSGMAENLDMRIQEARCNRLDFDEFLELLIDDELAMRQNKSCYGKSNEVARVK